MLCRLLSLFLFEKKRMDNRLFPPYTKKKKNLKDQTHKLFFTVPILGLFPFGPDTLGYIGQSTHYAFGFSLFKTN